MNIRDLEYLVAVSETLHFGQAARRCFVSQPTLSGQIHKLEQELGATLFERTNRSVHVTPIGQKIIGHARQILEQAEVIRSLGNTQNDPLAGPLRIGAIHTLSPYLVPLFMLELQHQHPELSLELTEATTDQLIIKLREHQLDGALLATPPPARISMKFGFSKSPSGWPTHGIITTTTKTRYRFLILRMKKSCCYLKSTASRSRSSTPARSTAGMSVIRYLG